MCGILLKEIKEDLKDFGAICVYGLEDSILSRCFFPIKLYIQCNPSQSSRTLFFMHADKLV